MKRADCNIIEQAVSGEAHDRARAPHHAPELIDERLLSRTSNYLFVYIFVLFLFFDKI